MNPEETYLKSVVEPLLAEPSSLMIERTTDDRGVLLTMAVGKEDMGRVIGKEGATAKALRTLLSQLGGHLKTHVSLKIVEPQNP